MAGGPEAFSGPMEGQLIVPGFAPNFGKPTNEDIIRGEVTEGRMEPEEAEAELKALAALAIRASNRQME